MFLLVRITCYEHQCLTRHIAKSTSSARDKKILTTEGTEYTEKDLKLQKNIASNITSYALEVDRLSTEKLIFRNQKATQTDVAKTLGVPTSHIVFLFKYHSNISFSEYRMHSRIKDAIGLMKDGFLEINTFESLAFKTGFASYNPFFSAFKKVTNHSPQEYLKNSLNPV